MIKGSSNYNKLHIIIIKTISLLIFFTGTAFADPAISDFTGTLVHGGSINITGSNFGIKDPAPPLMWDDCEGKTTDSDSAVRTSGWVDVWPILSGAAVESHRTRYRKSMDFRGVAAAHKLSSQYLAGGHYQYPNNIL